MTPSKILYSALTGTIAICLGLITAWASDTTTRMQALEVRANLAEQHFVAIQKDIQDIRERVQELKELIRDQSRYLPVVVTPPSAVRK